MAYTGFGDIQLSIQARIGGRIVSEGGSVAYEILKRLWLSEKSEDESKVSDKKKETLEVAPEYVKNIADEVQRILEIGEVPPGSFDKEVLEEMKEWLGKAQVKNTCRIDKIGPTVGKQNPAPAASEIFRNVGRQNTQSVWSL